MAAKQLIQNFKFYKRNLVFLLSNKKGNLGTRGDQGQIGISGRKGTNGIKGNGTDTLRLIF